MRKMATIRKIDNIDPIPDADAIEVATLGGWKVVIKKGEHQVGDLVVYCEIDSWIPTELAPFLSKGQEPREYNGIKGERLRTVKLRGQISQGLLLHRTVVLDKVGEIFEGMDVSDLLGIEKYDPPVPAQLAGEVRGNFPGFIPKTDQERIQNLSLELMGWVSQSTEWEITEKLDGSSMTVYVFGDDEGVCSRNLNLKENDTNSFWRLARQEDLIQKIKSTNRNLALQGELVGEGVQGNYYKLKGHKFFLFDIYDIDRGRYLLPRERQLLARELKINHVPIVEEYFNLNTEDTVSKLLSLAENRYSLLDKVEREGLVFKNTRENVSFKAISNKFLIKRGG
jgi:RNA ligase (TIGR02306 family)